MFINILIFNIKIMLGYYFKRAVLSPPSYLILVQNTSLIVRCVI